MQIRYTSADQWADAKDGVIPAPYALEEGEQITDQYLEPVIFHNENGPDIGVTTCGVIVKDGLYFKDLDNSGELAPYKDWRLTPEERAKDMVKHMRLDQQAGFVLNTLFNTPVVPTRAKAVDENGKLVMSKIFKHHDPSEKPMAGPLPGMTISIDDDNVLKDHIAAGVYRGDMNCEVWWPCTTTPAPRCWSTRPARAALLCRTPCTPIPSTSATPILWALALPSWATATPIWSMKWHRPTAR